MRPKTIVLLVGHRESQLAVRRFLLETRGFRVLSAMTVQAALDAVIRHDVRIAIVEVEFEEGDGVKLGVSLVGALKGLDGDLRAILVTQSLRPGSFAHQADAVLKECPEIHADLLARVKLMAARKRGPKKAVPSVGDAACARA